MIPKFLKVIELLKDGEEVGIGNQQVVMIQGKIYAKGFCETKEYLIPFLVDINAFIELCQTAQI